MKARTLINTKDSRYAPYYAPDCSTDNRTDRPCRSLTIPRTPLDASRDTLRVGRNGK
ncbi:hypothetical protein SAMN05444164_3906 [Bradyrhizobium erythrophlei]|uniref:Uncharacterized protein n=1 Tax=Bradyrhizobium erythrophlei TaxID=1437360 RepID=A0A1H4YE07_9BRAD|nr:hypothetical protein SAMN05444164_3906 [Bradyrhizobium erythrophlei]